MVEGEKSVVSLLNQNKYKILELFATEYCINETLNINQNIEVHQLDSQELRNITNLNSTPSVIALIESIPPTKLDLSQAQSAIYLDDVQDPGNVGTIMRIADWYGIEHLIRSTDSADFYNQKVLQSSMGSFANLHLHTLDRSLLKAESHEMQIISTALSGELLSQNMKVKKPLIILGNEGKGVSQELMDVSDISIKIQGHPNRIADSLNVAISAGIIANHFFGMNG